MLPRWFKSLTLGVLCSYIGYGHAAGPVFIDIHYGAITHDSKEYQENREILNHAYRDIDRQRLLNEISTPIQFELKDNYRDVIQLLKSNSTAGIVYSIVRTYDHQTKSRLVKRDLKSIWKDSGVKLYYTEDYKNARIEYLGDKNNTVGHGIVYQVINHKERQNFLQNIFKVRNQKTFEQSGVFFRINEKSETDAVIRSLRDPRVLGVIWLGHPAILKIPDGKDDDGIEQYKIVNSHLMSVSKSYIPKKLLTAAHSRLQFVSLATCHEEDVFERYKKYAPKNLSIVRPPLMRADLRENPLFSRVSMITGPKKIMQKIESSLADYLDGYRNAEAKAYSRHLIRVSYRDLKSSKFVYTVSVNGELVGVLNHLNENKRRGNQMTKEIRFDWPNSAKQLEIEIEPNDIDRYVTKEDIKKYGSRKLIDDILVSKIDFGHKELLRDAVHLGDDQLTEGESTWDLNYRLAFRHNLDVFKQAGGARKKLRIEHKITSSDFAVDDVNPDNNAKVEAPVYEQFNQIVGSFAENQTRGRWTYFFVIAGDKDNFGVNFNEVGTPLYEQAWQAYRDIQSMAKNDSNNNYVIFFDPYKSESFWSSSRARFEVYSGRKKLEHGWDIESEVNSANIRFLLYKVQKHAFEALGQQARLTKKLLYFYGEHIPMDARRSQGWDLSHPKEFVSVKSFVEGIKHFRNLGLIDLMVLHSCQMNTLHFLKSLSGTVANVIVSDSGIPNAKMNFRQATWQYHRNTKQVAEAILESNHRENLAGHDFRLKAYSLKHSSELFFLTEKLESLVDKKLYNRGIQYILKSKGQDSEWEAFGSYKPKPEFLAHTRELYVSLRDYLEFLRGFISSDSAEEFEKRLESVDKILSKHTGYNYLRVVIQPLY